MGAMIARVLFIVGSVMAAVGLVAGLVPVTADGDSCGSAFRRGWYSDSCDALTSSARVPAVALLVVGLALAAVGVVMLVAAMKPLTEA